MGSGELLRTHGRRLGVRGPQKSLRDGGVAAPTVFVFELILTRPWLEFPHRSGRGPAACRSEQPACERLDERGFRASENLRNLQKLRWAIEQEIDREIVRARDQGITGQASSTG